MAQTDPKCYLTVKTDATPIPIDIVRPEGVDAIMAELTSAQTIFLKALDFTAKAGHIVYIPGASGEIERIVFGVGSAHDPYVDGERQAGVLAEKLQPGLYRFSALPPDWQPRLAALFWGLGCYRFERYLTQKHRPPVLSIDKDTQEIISQYTAIVHGRDLINTPAADMGPNALQTAIETLANTFQAKVEAIVGDDLLTQNFPLIHAVGRAAAQAPRLLVLQWGQPDQPSLSLVGKGISFDTGGLDIKSAAGMRIMKKDMGGAAHALALAQMIMANELPVFLRVYLAVAENAISGNAYRPGDILTSRKGLTIEIDNTDAEGRLVLADALSRACEDDPDLVIDFATLTGAARVALGPTLPPFFSNKEANVRGIMQAMTAQKDPVWPMPLWREYQSLFNSPIADMKNAGGSFAGSITAALFLQKFVDERPWMHFDVYGWNPQTAPARPKGGEIFAVRGLYHWLKAGGLAEK